MQKLYSDETGVSGYISSPNITFPVETVTFQVPIQPLFSSDPDLCKSVMETISMYPDP